MTMWPDGSVEDADGGAGALHREAAGERAVTVVGGVDRTRQLLAAGLVDELRIDVVPVLLGAGRRLFDRTGPLALEELGIDEVVPAPARGPRVAPVGRTGDRSR